MPETIGTNSARRSCSALTALAGPAQVRGVEGQVGAHQAQLGDVAGQLAAVGGAARVAGRIQRVADPVVGVAHRMVQARQQHRAEGLRQHQAVHERWRRSCPARSPRRARARCRRWRSGSFDRREADQAGRVAGQHQQVGARRAVQQREVQAAADPQRQRQRQQLGRIRPGAAPGRSPRCAPSTVPPARYRPLERVGPANGAATM